MRKLILLFLFVSTSLWLHAKDSVSYTHLDVYKRQGEACHDKTPGTNYMDFTFFANRNCEIPVIRARKKVSKAYCCT